MSRQASFPLCRSHRAHSLVFSHPRDFGQILKGDLLTVYGSKVLRLNSWASSHPGGELVLQHFVGRDATDEIDAYHSEHTLTHRVPKFCVGRVDEEVSIG
jgi:cytochrome b involved in lipid metabolism